MTSGNESGIPAFFREALGPYGYLFIFLVMPFRIIMFG